MLTQWSYIGADADAVVLETLIVCLAPLCLNVLLEREDVLRIGAQLLLKALEA